jgi:hypothetical protein
MPDNSLQYHNEREALETLLNSEELKSFSKTFEDSDLVIGVLSAYYDSLCLHDWKVETPDNHDDYDYVREICRKCKAEREGSTRRDP